MISTVVTDLVSLRERGKYMALTQIAATLGAALGPFLGGLFTNRSTWRWVFYINVPIGGSEYSAAALSIVEVTPANSAIVAFVALFMFLRLNYQRDQTWKHRLARIDVYGNAIFIAAIVAVLLALTWGGTIYSWGGYRIIVPLALGFLGLALFLAFEWNVSKEPSFPRIIVSNITSAIALAQTLLHAICVYWAFYFLPIYFQAVRGLSPLRSGKHTRR